MVNLFNQCATFQSASISNKSIFHFYFWGSLTRMKMNELLILAGIGIAAGMFSGMFGIGGGMVMVPAMVFILGMSQHAAQGTSLGVLVIPVAAVAAFNYYKAGQLDPKYALIMAVTFMLGGYLGAKISLGISELVLKRIFGVLMLVMAIKLIFFTKGNPA